MTASREENNKLLENLGQIIMDRLWDIKKENTPLRKFEQTTLLSVSVHPETMLSLMDAIPEPHRRRIWFSGDTPQLVGITLVETLDSLDGWYRLNEKVGVI